jgi:hypothetical protein
MQHRKMFEKIQKIHNVSLKSLESQLEIKEFGLIQCRPELDSAVEVVLPLLLGERMSHQIQVIT